MRYRRTPPLSLEGSREVLEEMANPPKDTPERRATEERVRIMQEVRKRCGADKPLPPLRRLPDELMSSSDEEEPSPD